MKQTLNSTTIIYIPEWQWAGRWEKQSNITQSGAST